MSDDKTTAPARDVRAYTTTKPFEAGSKVRALVRITDDAGAGQLRAEPGDIGEVLGYPCDDEVPSIKWARGIYDSPASQLESVA